MWSRSPPRASVIALVGIPELLDVPPQGASFCGSPSSFWTSMFVGSNRTKWGEAADDASKTTAPTARPTEFLISKALTSVFERSTPGTLSHQKQEGEGPRRRSKTKVQDEGSKTRPRRAGGARCA